MIGSGGQSVVYRARDRVDRDLVALKICEWTDPSGCERMFREANVMSQLQGTAAVRVLHQCQTEDGTMALVMELLEGDDLGALLSQMSSRGERTSFAWMRQILDPIVHTLDLAHQRGIVHRDVKAENVFVLANDGGVRLLDFGFAKMLRAPAITASDAIAGSPGYIAPEIWREGAWCADARADIYALGVLVFRILGGRLPFQGTTIEIARRAMSDERPSLHALRPDVSPDVDAWVRQVLAVDPNHRFSRITGAWRALEGTLAATSR